MNAAPPDVPVWPSSRLQRPCPRRLVATLLLALMTPPNHALNAGRVACQALRIRELSDDHNLRRRETGQALHSHDLEPCSGTRTICIPPELARVRLKHKLPECRVGKAS